MKPSCTQNVKKYLKNVKRIKIVYFGHITEMKGYLLQLQHTEKYRKGQQGSEERNGYRIKLVFSELGEQ